MGRLEGKVAIVTGGSRGMGAATVRLFVERGAKVIGDVLVAEGEALAKELGDAAVFVKLDVRSEEDWAAAVKTATDRFGKLDTLINNAAVVHFTAIEAVSAEDIERVLGINVKGTMLGVKHCAPALIASGKDAIVNISSVDGLRGCNGLSVYTASKWTWGFPRAWRGSLARAACASTRSIPAASTR